VRGATPTGHPRPFVCCAAQAYQKAGWDAYLSRVA